MKPVKMLVVDDAVQICRGIRDGIEWEKHGVEEVYAAYDGASALNWFEEHLPEIVIADIRMAGLDGLELSREILKRRPKTRIILLSAHSEFDYAREALRLGVFAYELKPLKVETLVGRVEEAGREWHSLMRKDDAAAQYARICREQKLERILDGQECGQEEITSFLSRDYGLGADQEYLCAVFAEDGPQDGEAALHGMLAHSEAVWLARCTQGHIVLFPCANSLLYVEKVIADVQRMLRAESRNTFSCGISAHGKLKNIAGMLAQARAALALRFYTGENSLNRWNAEAVFRNEAIPAGQASPLGEGRGETAEWAEVVAQIHAAYDEIGRQRPYYAPQSVHAFTLEFMRALRQNLRRWLEEDDRSVSESIYALERGGPLPFFSLYREEAVRLYRSVYDLYFGDGGDMLGHFAIRCKCYIQQHYPRDLRVQEMAERFCVSPNYFSHLFKKNMGVSFKQYLNSVRIRQADLLLEQGRMQAAEVAREVGFVDYKYFHQVYRKYKGCAPTGAGGPQPK